MGIGVSRMKPARLRVCANPICNDTFYVKGTQKYCSVCKPMIRAEQLAKAKKRWYEKSKLKVQGE